MPVDRAGLTDSYESTLVLQMLSRAGSSASSVSYRSNQSRRVPLDFGGKEDDFDSSSETGDESEGGDWVNCSNDLSHQSKIKAFSISSNMSKEDFLDFHESVIPKSPVDESNNQGNISRKNKLQGFLRVLLLRF